MFTIDSENGQRRTPHPAPTHRDRFPDRPVVRQKLANRADERCASLSISSAVTQGCFPSGQYVLRSVVHPAVFQRSHASHQLPGRTRAADKRGPPPHPVRLRNFPGPHARSLLGVLLWSDILNLSWRPAEDPVRSSQARSDHVGPP